MTGEIVCLAFAACVLEAALIRIANANFYVVQKSSDAAFRARTSPHIPKDHPLGALESWRLNFGISSPISPNLAKATQSYPNLAKGVVGGEGPSLADQPKSTPPGRKTNQMQINPDQKMNQADKLRVTFGSQALPRLSKSFQAIFRKKKIVYFFFAPSTLQLFNHAPFSF